MTPTMTSAAPAQAPAPAAVTPNLKPPPYPPDDFIRYGSILAPNTDAGYPFKLTMPGPGFGEMKVPNQGEFAMRQKLENLAKLSDAQIWDQLRQWPAFSKMSLADDGAMLARIQNFRDYRYKMAQDEWHRLGLTLNPEQQARFEKDYWNRKLQMDRQLAQQLEGPYKAAQQKLNEDLYREFSMPGPLAKAPPAPPKPAAPKPQTLTNAASSAPLAH